MVQIIKRPERPEKQQDFGDKFSQAILGISEAMQQKQDLAESDKLLEENYGIKLSGIKDPRMRELVVSKALQSQSQQLDDESYNVIKQHFGEDAADIYKASTTGGKTAFLNQLLESKQRGLDVEDKIQSVLGKEELETPGISLEEPTEKKKFIDFDKGLTPKERVARQERRYEKNLPLFQESQTKLRALEAERTGLDILEDLSPKISGLDKLNVNPRSGELIIPTFASPEAQRYVKTINDFTTKAKDSFGSRVTNFDLVQFLKRLPTLANSEEGRRQLIEQMKIINELNNTYEQSLQDTIDEYGGIRNIDFDKAERIAEKESKNKISSLKKQFQKIESNSEKTFEKNTSELKKITPKGHVSVQRADGTTGYIPQENLKAFLQISGNKIL